MQQEADRFIVSDDSVGEEMNAIPSSRRVSANVARDVASDASAIMLLKK